MPHRFLSLMFMLGGVFLFALTGAVAGEEPEKAKTDAHPAPVIDPKTDPNDDKFVENWRANSQKSLEELKTGFQALDKKLADEKTEADKKLVPGSAPVTIDEDTTTVNEPTSFESAMGYTNPERRIRDEYEVSPDDFDMFNHERWSINTSDFKFDQPQYVTAEFTAGHEKTWWGFTFSVTNSTSQRRRMAPFFTVVTNKGVFNQAVGGLVPERAMADSTFRPLGGSEKLADKELLDQNVSPQDSPVRLADYAQDPRTHASKLVDRKGLTFEPGQTRWGAALWSNFTNEFTELKVVVHGLTNAHRYEEKMRRVMIITFERIDDEFNVYRTPLKYKNKSWEYLWMWDQDISVPIPADAKDPQIKSQRLATPANGERQVWAFPFVIRNSTRWNQQIAINQVAFVCPVEVEIGGARVPVEAKVIDDGRSTIYKAQLLKALQKDSPKDRYEMKNMPVGSKTQTERHTITLEPGKALEETLAVFDENDVDWDNLVMQVESALTEKVDKRALAKQNWEHVVQAIAPNDKTIAAKDPGNLYDPRRRLSEEEIKQVKEQVSKAIPGAIEAAKSKKLVVAYFDCTSALSTGEFRVSRSYRQPGVVDESWLKAWEDLDKAVAK